MNYLKKGLENLKVGVSAKALGGMGMAVAGAITYLTIPTMIEAFSMKKTEAGDNVVRIPMTGPKGCIVGILTTVIGGLAAGSPEFALGGLAAGTAHFSFARLNDWVFYPVFGKHLFVFDPKSLGDDTSTLPAGAREVTVGNKKVTVFDRASVDATPVSGYRENILPQAVSTVDGYAENALPPATPNMNAVNGFGQGLTPQATTTVSGFKQGLTPQAKSPLSGFRSNLTSQSSLSDSSLSRFAQGVN